MRPIIPVPVSLLPIGIILTLLMDLIKLDAILIEYIYILAMPTLAFACTIYFDITQYKDRMTKYQQKLEMWNKSWVCLRCGNTWQTDFEIK